ncbi:hypothetical protein D3C87_936880 [compost metagenome]
MRAQVGDRKARCPLGLRRESASQNEISMWGEWLGQDANRKDCGCPEALILPDIKVPRNRDDQEIERDDDRPREQWRVLRVHWHS